MSRIPARLAATVAGSVALTALAVAGPVPAGAAPAAPAAGTSSATPGPAAPGNRSLAAVLGADGTRFDRNAQDFDIAEAAVLAVLAEKPRSPLRLATKGRQRLTVFLPTDGAFRRFVKDLSGRAPVRERAVFRRTAALAGDIDTLETILLYHVVAGRTLTSPKVVRAAETKRPIRTAQGGTIGVRPAAGGATVRLVDADRDDRDARAIPDMLDINRGNKQVAHGIDRVLRPLDL